MNTSIGMLALNDTGTCGAARSRRLSFDDIDVMTSLDNDGSATRTSLGEVASSLTTAGSLHFSSVIASFFMAVVVEGSSTILVVCGAAIDSSSSSRMLVN